jgi:hypothetical protein
MRHLRLTHDRTGSRAAAVLACTALAAVAAACGPQTEPTMRGCVVVDMSGSSRPELTDTYLPGFQKFVRRIATEGTGDVCFTLTAKGSVGGSAMWAHFACTNPSDTLRCPPEIRRNVRAAAEQISAAGKGPNPLRGASEIVEGIASVARATESGDEILVLSDAIQSSKLTGNFYNVTLDDASIDEIIDRIQTSGLLPDLEGQALRIPYAVYHSGPNIGLTEAEKEAILDFWRAYARRAKAKLHIADGERDA